MPYSGKTVAAAKATGTTGRQASRAAATGSGKGGNGKRGNGGASGSGATGTGKTGGVSGNGKGRSGGGRTSGGGGAQTPSISPGAAGFAEIDSAIAAGVAPTGPKGSYTAADLASAGIISSPAGWVASTPEIASSVAPKVGELVPGTVAYKEAVAAKAPAREAYELEMQRVQEEAWQQQQEVRDKQAQDKLDATRAKQVAEVGDFIPLAPLKPAPAPIKVVPKEEAAGVGDFVPLAPLVPAPPIPKVAKKGAAEEDDFVPLAPLKPAPPIKVPHPLEAPKIKVASLAPFVPLAPLVPAPPIAQVAVEGVVPSTLGAPIVGVGLSIMSPATLDFLPVHPPGVKKEVVEVAPVGALPVIRPGEPLGSEVAGKFKPGQVMSHRHAVELGYAQWEKGPSLTEHEAQVAGIGKKLEDTPEPYSPDWGALGIAPSAGKYAYNIYAGKLRKESGMYPYGPMPEITTGAEAQRLEEKLEALVDLHPGQGSIFSSAPGVGLVAPGVGYVWSPKKQGWAFSGGPAVGGGPGRYIMTPFGRYYRQASGGIYGGVSFGEVGPVTLKVGGRTVVVSQKEWKEIQGMPPQEQYGAVMGLIPLETAPLQTSLSHEIVAVPLVAPGLTAEGIRAQYPSGGAPFALYGGLAPTKTAPRVVTGGASNLLLMSAMGPQDTSGFWAGLRNLITTPESRARAEEALAVQAARRAAPKVDEGPYGPSWQKKFKRPVFEPLGIKGVTVGDVEKVSAVVGPGLLLGGAALVAGPAVLPAFKSLLGATFAPIIKTGAAVVTTTGVAALVKGAFIEPTTQEEAKAFTAGVEGMSPRKDIEVARITVEGLEASYKAAVDTLHAWDSYLVDDTYVVPEEHYGRFMVDFQAVVDAGAEYDIAFGGYEGTFGGLLAAQARVNEWLDPTTGKINTRGMFGELGETQATILLAQAGYKPEIDRGIWQNLSKDARGYFTPTTHVGLEHREGILGVYGRGAQWQQGLLENLRGDHSWYHPASLAAGFTSYLAPHGTVSELYPTVGPTSFGVLVPHFGPTAVYSTIAPGLSGWQRAAGYGFAALPYVAGPAVSLSRGIGGVISKVPVVGPVIRTVGRVGAFPFKVAGAGAHAIRLEQWAPWKASYQVSGLAGKAGLAKVPGLGPRGAQWGWWPKEAVPSYQAAWRQKVAGVEAKARPFERVELDIVEGMRGPKVLGPVRISFSKVQRGDYALVHGTKTSISQVKAMGGNPADYVWYRPPELIGAVAPRGPIPKYPWPRGEFRPYPYTPGGKGASAVVQRVQVPSGWGQVAQFAKQAAPRLALAGTMAAPVIAGAFLPMVAPAMFTQTQVDITAVDQMLVRGQITQVQHGQMVQSLEKVQQQELTQRQAEQEVQQVLTQEQQQQYEVTQQQQVQTQVDIAAVGQMLVQRQISPEQHSQIVRQIEQVGQQELTQRQARQVVEQVMTREQVQQYRQAQQQVQQAPQRVQQYTPTRQVWQGQFIPTTLPQQVQGVQMLPGAEQMWETQVLPFGAQVQPIQQEMQERVQVQQQMQQRQIQQEIQEQLQMQEQMQLQQMQQQVQIQQVQIQQVQEQQQIQQVIQIPIKQIPSVVPPVIPPFLPFWWRSGAAGIMGGYPRGRGAGLLGQLGEWVAPGMRITAPHPLLKEVASGIFGARRVKHGAIAKRKLGTLSTRTGSTGPLVNASRQYVPTYKGV